MSRIKLKTKPKKPTRYKNLKDEMEILDGLSVLEFKQLIIENEIPEHAWISISSDDIGYGDFVCYVSVNWEREETDKEYQLRLDNYQKSLTKYNNWYNKNKDLIEKEIELRNKEKAAHRKRESELNRRQLQKQKKQLEGMLNKIEQQLKT